ncbi:hypothetical protein ENROMM299B_05970 [Enterobacter roggenkampii]
MKALQHRELAGDRGLGAGDIVHSKEGRKGGQQQQRRPYPGRIGQPQGGTVILRYALHAQEGKHRQEDHQRRDQLHHADAQVAEPAVNTERATLFCFGEEEADVAHAGGKVGACKAAEQGNHDKDPVRRRGVLNGHPQPDAGNDQDDGTQYRPVSSAKYGHHKRIGDAQYRAGERR